MRPDAVRLAREREDRVGDVVDRHDVDRRRAAAGDQRHRGALRVRAQRRVDDVERGGPAGLLLADDDAGAERSAPAGARRMRARAARPPTSCARSCCGSPARRRGRPRRRRRSRCPRRRRSRRARSAAAAARIARPGQLEQPPCPLDVDLARLLERQRERHRGGRVDDLRERCGEREPPAAGQPEARQGDVAAHRQQAVIEAFRRLHHARHRRPQARLRLRVVARPHERVDGPVGALEVAREQLHPEEAGRPGQQQRSVRGGWRRGRRKEAHRSSSSLRSPARTGISNR